MFYQLSPTSVCGVDSGHLPRFRAIDDEDYSGVVRKTIEVIGRRSDYYIGRALFALKQYYAVALLDPANAHAVPVRVDPWWHSHILHTEQYHRFCQRVVGEYMHHSPLDSTNVSQVENVRTLSAYTHEIVQKLFNTVDAGFWTGDLSDGAMICYHKGNQDIYIDVQPLRLFPPNVRGATPAFGELAAI